MMYGLRTRTLLCGAAPPWRLVRPKKVRSFTAIIALSRDWVM
jgi:hypothetical protein